MECCFGVGWSGMLVSIVACRKRSSPYDRVCFSGGLLLQVIMLLHQVTMLLQVIMRLQDWSSMAYETLRRKVDSTKPNGDTKLYR